MIYPHGAWACRRQVCNLRGCFLVAKPASASSASGENLAHRMLSRVQLWQTCFNLWRRKLNLHQYFCWLNFAKVNCISRAWACRRRVCNLRGCFLVAKPASAGSASGENLAHRMLSRVQLWQTCFNLWRRRLNLHQYFYRLNFAKVNCISGAWACRSWVCNGSFEILTFNFPSIIL